MRSNTLVLPVVLAACSAQSDDGDATVAVWVNYACASAEGRGTRCWGGTTPLLEPPDDTQEPEFELGLPADVDMADLSADGDPMGVDTAGRVHHWGAWRETPGNVVVAEGAVLVDGFHVLTVDGDLVEAIHGTVIATDVAVFAGQEPCWASDAGAIACVDDLVRGHAADWVDLDRRGTSLCGVTADGEMSCLAGPNVGLSWDDTAAFPQRDHLPRHPRWVQVETDFDGPLCLRDALGRVACRGGGVPDVVVDRDGWVDLDIASGTACAVRADGEVVCWGDDAYGERSP